jgi:hypothetical protein
MTSSQSNLKSVQPGDENSALRKIDGDILVDIYGNGAVTATSQENRLPCGCTHHVQGHHTSPQLKNVPAMPADSGCAPTTRSSQGRCAGTAGATRLLILACSATKNIGSHSMPAQANAARG